MRWGEKTTGQGLLVYLRHYLRQIDRTGQTWNRRTVICLVYNDKKRLTSGTNTDLSDCHESFYRCDGFFLDLSCWGKVVSGRTNLDASARTLVFLEYLAHFGIRGKVFQIVRVKVVGGHDTKRETLPVSSVGMLSRSFLFWDYLQRLYNFSYNSGYMVIAFVRVLSSWRV